MRYYIYALLLLLCLFITPAYAEIPLSYSDDEPPLPFYDKPYSAKPARTKPTPKRQILPSFKQAELSPDIRSRAEDLAARIFGDDFRESTAPKVVSKASSTQGKTLPRPEEFAVPARRQKILSPEDTAHALADASLDIAESHHAQSINDTPDLTENNGVMLEARTDNRGRGAYIASDILESFLRDILDEKIDGAYLLSASGLSKHRGYFVRLPSQHIHAEHEYVTINDDNHRFEIAVMFRADNDFERVVFRGRAEPAAMVLAPAKAIAAGVIITKAMLTDVIVSQKAAETMLTDPQKIIGKSAARILRPDRPLRARDVKSPTLIKRNAVIDIEYSAPGIFLRTTAQASQDGAAGDIIRARNIAGDKIIYAQVTGTNTARAVEQGTN